MEAYDVYRDIAERTGGSVFAAVVGPVRTGKSTLITKIMEALVLPNVADVYEKQRITDELPQSGAGRTIMTTQPKFVPNEAVEIELDEKAKLKIRLVDCVGYLVDGALGQNENDYPRMVRTPWFDHDIPFEQAAEVGTKKVIDEHATIGIVVLADESVAGISHESYLPAEVRVIKELRENGKPFIIILNSAEPQSGRAAALKKQMEEDYGAPVKLMNIMQFSKDDMAAMLADILYEFPLKQLNISIPAWICALDKEHWLLNELLACIDEAGKGVASMRDYAKILEALGESPSVKKANAEAVMLGSGTANIDASVKDELFYKVIGDECGYEIKDDAHLISIIKDLATAKAEYDKVESALKSVYKTGYGVVPPDEEEMSLIEPELVRQGNKFGIKLKANAPCMHVIRVDVETEVSPIIGTETQSKELIDYLMSEFKNDPAQIWETDLFGKSLSELVKDGINAKMTNIPSEAKQKLQEMLGRMVNEGDGGMLCVLL